jgi:hypothetical protein
MSATIGAQLDNFTKFPELPPELRELIWRTTLQPRVIEIDYDDCEGFRSRWKAYPIALRVCKESREAVIGSYPLCFGSIFHPAQIRFNFSMDTVYLNFDYDAEDYIPHFFNVLKDHEIRGLKYMAIPSSVEDEVGYMDNIARAVESLSGLQSLSVVYDVEDMRLDGRCLSGCGADHAMDLFEKLPDELQDPKLKINELPNPPEPHLLNPEFWKLSVCHRVYGWRRCPMFEVLSDDDTDEDELEDESALWMDGGFPGMDDGFPPYDMMRLYYPDLYDLDSDDDDEDEGEGEEEDNDEDGDEGNVGGLPDESDSSSSSDSEI